MGSSLKSIILTATLAVLALLGKTWFDGVNANAQELGKLKTKVEVSDEQYTEILRRLESIESKMDVIYSSSRPYTNR